MLAIGVWGWVGIALAFIYVPSIVYGVYLFLRATGILKKFPKQYEDSAQLNARFRENDVVVSAPAAKGGIDLAQMNVEAGKSAEGIPMKFDPALLEKLRNAKTFRPVIFGIHPADANTLQNSWGIAPAR